MAYAVLQTKTNTSTLSTTLAITMTSTAAGSAIKVMAGSTSSTAGITCTDNKGNTYTAQSTGGATSTFGTLFTCYGATSGVTTITLTYPDTTIHAAMAREYSGVSALDQKAAATTTGTNPTSGNTSTTSQANELVFGALVVNRSPGLTAPTVGAGFGNFSVVTSGSAAFAVAMEDKAVAVTGTYAAVFADTNSTQYFCAVNADTLTSTTVANNSVISF